MKTPYVAILTQEKMASLHSRLKDKDFTLSKPQHTLFQARKPGLTCTAYLSGKVVVQGKEAQEFIEFFLEPEIIQDFSLPEAFIPHSGIDESGKGDLFGPLCVAGVYADTSQVEKLRQIGVKDSKTLSDPQISVMAKQIAKLCPYHLITLKPIKYNELYTSFRNLNSLLGWAHAVTIESLIEKSGCSRVIIDQFASEHVVLKALSKRNLEVDLTQRHKGEEDIVVAAASILARAAFVSGLEALSRECGVKLKKGASEATVEAGRQFVRKHGREKLPYVCKMHFKTVAKL